MSNFPSIDIRTIGFLFALNSIGFAAAILFSARSYPKAIAQSLTAFGIGKILIAVGFSLVGLRGVMPASLSVIGATFLVICGVCTNYMAVRLIFGRMPNILALSLICLMVMLGSAYFTFYAHDLRGVRILNSMTAAAIMGAIAYELLWNNDHPGMARFVGGWLAVIIAGVAAIRAVISFFGPSLPPGIYQGTSFEIIFLLINFMGASLGSVNLVLLSNDLFNQELVELTRTDALTGIANRRRLTERGTEEWRRSRRFGTPMAVLAMDLDHFKRINDTHGHATGDAVLRSAAQAFGTEIRDVDFIARSGGEEFVVILAGADGEVAQGIAERLRRTMESLPIQDPKGEPLTVTISIGLAILGSDDSFDALWHRADAALYQAKNQGRNRVALA